ncbi:MAG: transposase, partial [Herbaspirillum sp.]|nr:transposase [Herbaspirillum sp.]
IEGKIEGKIETAKAMLAKNMSIELIAELTGLTEEEIKHL